MFIKILLTILVISNNIQNKIECRYLNKRQIQQQQANVCNQNECAYVMFILIFLQIYF